MVVSKMPIKNYPKKLLKNNEGQSIVEYVFLLSFIAIVVVAVLTAIGVDVTGKFNEVLAGFNG